MSDIYEITITPLDGEECGLTQIAKALQQCLK